MSNIINTNYTAGIYSNSVNKQARCKQVETMSFADKMAEKSESAVEQYKREHPESVLRVDGQVRAGRSVIAKNGADNVSREDMTMEEYKLSNKVDNMEQYETILLGYAGVIIGLN